MHQWRYALPIGFWLLYGTDIRGIVTARSRSDARAEVKQKLARSYGHALDRFPVGGLLEKVAKE